MGSYVNPADGGQPPGTLSALLDQLIDRNSYNSLRELSRHTSIPYQTLWSWQKGTRNLKRPPTVETIRKFAADFGLPEATVFRAAGRAYTDPGALDANSLALLELYKSLPDDDQARVVRIVAMVAALSPDKRSIAEGVIRGIVSSDKSHPSVET
jgi:transcriptional regulator with XRE-family HTH domain